MKSRASTRFARCLPLFLIMAIPGGWLVPGTAFANAILTAPQPDLGSFGTGVGVRAGSGSAYDPGSLANVSNFLSGFDNHFGNGQTTASANIIDPDVECINCAIAASASADVATGTMHLYADALSSQAGAQAALLETILPQATGTEHFELSFNGTGVNGSNNSWPFAFFQILSYQNGYLLPSEGINYLLEGGPLADSFFSTDLSTVNGTYGFDVNLIKDDPTEIQLYMNINASPVPAPCVGACDSNWDFSHTIGLTASGVDFTSASGVFLTSPNVPEPGAVWLFGLGLVGLFGIARRKRKEQKAGLNGQNYFFTPQRDKHGSTR